MPPQHHAFRRGRSIPCRRHRTGDRRAPRGRRERGSTPMASTDAPAGSVAGPPGGSAPGGGPYAVELRGITKRFPGVVANKDIELTVRRGEVHAIVGENGAGKSTLMKTLYGEHRPDEGEILIDGRRVHFRSPSDAIAAGIGMVHQHFMLADNFTVWENIVLGSEPTRGGRLNRAAGSPSSPTATTWGCGPTRS